MNRLTKLSVILLLLGSYGGQLFCQDQVFPYRLHKYKEPLLLLSAATLDLSSYTIGKNISGLTNEEILALDRKDIHPFDRSATYNWSIKSQKNSNITKNSLKFLPGFLLLPEVKNKQWANCLTIGLMYFEAYYLNSNITNITKVTVRRNRPYLYNTSFSEDERVTFRDHQNSYKSFFSGHTSAAFCSAAFLSKVYSDIYGRSKWSYLISGISFSLAATTGYLRWKGGVHYPTDIIAGAIVGTSIGYLIPSMHKIRNKRFEAYILPNQFYICYSL